MKTGRILLKAKGRDNLHLFRLWVALKSTVCQNALPSRAAKPRKLAAKGEIGDETCTELSQRHRLFQFAGRDLLVGVLALRRPRSDLVRSYHS